MAITVCDLHYITKMLLLSRTISLPTSYNHIKRLANASCYLAIGHTPSLITQHSSLKLLSLYVYLLPTQIIRYVHELVEYNQSFPNAR